MRLLFFVIINLFYLSVSAQWQLIATVSDPIFPEYEYSCFCSKDTGVARYHHFLSPTSGYILTTDMTYNGASSWTTVSSGHAQEYSFSFECSKVRNSKILWNILNAGGYIEAFISNDGGLHWSFRGTVGLYMDFSPIDSNNCFYITNHNTLRRLNFANQITQITVDSFTTINAKYISFTDTINGFLVASTNQDTTNHLVNKTMDGGFSWTNIYSDTSSNFNCILFTSSNNGYVAGSKGKIIRTKNGGNTWQDVSAGVNKEINVINFFNDSIGVAGGDSGLVLITLNGGVNWSLENIPSLYSIKEIYCFNDSIIYAFDGYSYYKEILNLTGINETDNPPITIYPNPNSGKLNIILPDKLKNRNISIRFFDLAGRVVKEFPVQNAESKFSVDVSSFSSGCYLVEFNFGNKKMNSKIIIQ
jgi:hypothetical protein